MAVGAARRRGCPRPSRPTSPSSTCARSPTRSSRASGPSCASTATSSRWRTSATGPTPRSRPTARRCICRTRWRSRLARGLLSRSPCGYPALAPCAGPPLLPLPTPSTDPRRRRPLPALGLGVASHGLPLSARELELLRAVHPSHLRVDVTPGDPGWEDGLHRAADQARSLGCALEVALVLSDAAREELGAVAGLAPTLGCELARWLIFHRGEAATTERWVSTARQLLLAGLPRRGHRGRRQGLLHRAQPWSPPRLRRPGGLLGEPADPRLRRRLAGGDPADAAARGGERRPALRRQAHRGEPGHAPSPVQRGGHGPGATPRAGRASRPGRRAADVALRRGLDPGKPRQPRRQRRGQPDVLRDHRLARRGRDPRRVRPSPQRFPSAARLCLPALPRARRRWASSAAEPLVAGESLGAAPAGGADAGGRWTAADPAGQPDRPAGRGARHRCARGRPDPGAGPVQRGTGQPRSRRLPGRAGRAGRRAGGRAPAGARAPMRPHVSTGSDHGDRSEAPCSASSRWRARWPCVTGAAGGIGRVLASTLAGAGASVALHDLLAGPAGGGGGGDRGCGREDGVPGGGPGRRGPGARAGRPRAGVPGPARHPRQLRGHEPAQAHPRGDRGRLGHRHGGGPEDPSTS